MKKRRITKRISINFKPEKKNIPWVIAVVFIFLQVFITIQTATSGAVLVNLEKQKTELEEKNRLLSEEIVRSSSLLSSKEKAEELGFTAPKKLLYIKGSESVAKLP